MAIVEAGQLRLTICRCPTVAIRRPSPAIDGDFGGAQGSFSLLVVQCMKGPDSLFVAIDAPLLGE